MRKYLNVLFGISLFCFFSMSYAISINVQSTSNEVAGLGFTVNGKNHGGRGNSYTATNMPAGTYTFGIRVGNSLFGKDVSCYTGNGMNRVNLKNNTNAILEYDGKNCKLRLS